MAAFGLYTHIKANRRRSVALVVGLFFLVYVLTFAFALLLRALDFGAPVAGGGLQDYLRAAAHDLVWLSLPVTLGTALWVWLGARFHQSIIDGVTGSQTVSREENPRVYNLLENLCIARGVPTPSLRIMDSAALNAFATGMTSGQYAVTVTRGLTEALDDAELEAVLAHELTHIRNEDVRLMVTAVVIAGVISFFGELVFRWFDVFPRWSGRRSRDSDSGTDSKGKGGAFVAILIALVLIAVAWAFSLAIRFALSRSREYLADAGSVELTKNPDAMISALVKIAGRGELEEVPSGLMEMCVDNPRSGFADLFATHPAIEDRIEALVRYAGGHRPPSRVEPPALGAPPGPWEPADQLHGPEARQPAMRIK